MQHGLDRVVESFRFAREFLDSSFALSSLEGSEPLGFGLRHEDRGRELVFTTVVGTGLVDEAEGQTDFGGNELCSHLDLLD